MMMIARKIAFFSIFFSLLLAPAAANSPRAETAKVVARGFLAIDAKTAKISIKTASGTVVLDVDSGKLADLRRLNGRYVAAKIDVEAAKDITQMSLKHFILRDVAEAYPKGKGGQVRGTVAVQGAGARILLPGVRVELTNLEHNKVYEGQTDEFGAYRTAAPAGLYRLDVHAEGFAAPETQAHIAVETGVVTAPELTLNAVGRLVTGRVAFKDAHPALYRKATFQMNSKATVVLQDGSGQAQAKTAVNGLGGYAFAGLKAGRYVVEAYFEGGKGRCAALLDDVSSASCDITLDNARPKIISAVAYVGDKAVKRLHPGQRVEVRVVVEEPDGDDYTIWWRSGSEDTPQSGKSLRTLTWQASKTPVKQSYIERLYMVVGDGRGGYGERTLSLTVVGAEDPGMVFSGRVSDRKGRAIKGATVRIGESAVQTNAKGGFLLTVKREQRAYQLVISKRNYGSVYQALRSSAIKLKFQLDKAVNVASHKQMLVSPIQTKRRASMHPNVELRAPNLRLPDGTLPAGDVGLSVAVQGAMNENLRLANDGAAIDAEGKAGRLTPETVLGVIEVQAADSDGGALKMASGSRGTLRFPVPDKLAQSIKELPKWLPLWRFEPKQGVWKQAGNGALSGAQYVAQVTKLANYTLGNSTKTTSCLELSIDEQIMYAPFELELRYSRFLDKLKQQIVGVSFNVGLDLASVSVITKLRHTFQDDTRTFDEESTVSGLPANRDITIQYVDRKGRLVPGATETVNTGPPGPIEVEVQDNGFLLLKQRCESVLLNFKLNKEGTNQLLEFKNDGSPEEAAKYYKAIGALEDPEVLAPLANLEPFEPLETLETLAKWKATFGFDDGDDGDAAAAALYFNAGDLGFGRDMHMKKKSDANGNLESLAYYVTNYNSVEDKLAGGAKIATVAMEYSTRGVKNQGDPAFIKFYVYFGDDNIIDRADLDGRGEKYVPNLCSVCHEGSEFPANDPNADPSIGVRFLPFDLDAFDYAQNDPNFTREAQELDFKKMNLEILNSDLPFNHPIKGLIDGWYSLLPPFCDLTVPAKQAKLNLQVLNQPAIASLFDSLSFGISHDRITQNSNYLPSGWCSHPQLYKQVVAVGCRGCHISRADNRSMDTFSKFKALNFSGLLKKYVCDDLSMPHAKATQQNLWLSADDPIAALANANIVDVNDCKGHGPWGKSDSQ